VSSTDIVVDSEQHEGCFHAASRRLRKRKHSETDENDIAGAESSHKSIFTTIKEKLGFGGATETRVKPAKSILSSVNGVLEGEHSLCYQHNGVTNKRNGVGVNDYDDDDDGGFKEYEANVIPRKRVKFDEENLIVSSITFQRQRDAMYMQQTTMSSSKKKKEEEGEESLFTRFINFTANLF
jgi:hypothetical protein